MKKVVDYDRIEEVSKNIKNKCDAIDEELKKILISINNIREVDKTDNMILLLNRYDNEVNELKKFINVIDYYTNYMDTISNYYGGIYTDYSKRLANNLTEMGGINGKNRF